MKILLDLIYQKLTADTALTALVPETNIYAGGTEVIKAYPSITFVEIGGLEYTVPKAAKVSIMRIGGWSNTTNVDLDTFMDIVKEDMYGIDEEFEGHRIVWSRTTQTRTMLDTERHLMSKFLSITFNVI